jgi:hypothetical protein
MSDKPNPTPTPTPAPPRRAPAMSAADEKALITGRFRASRGAQVVLDPASDASLGARGAAGGEMMDNVVARDAHLLAHSLDPRDPDATHLPMNTVPPGGELVDKVDDKHEPVFKPPVVKD